MAWGKPRSHGYIGYTEEAKRGKKRGTCSDFPSVIPRVDIIVTFFLPRLDKHTTGAPRRDEEDPRLMLVPVQSESYIST